MVKKSSFKLFRIWHTCPNVTFLVSLPKPTHPSFLSPESCLESIKIFSLLWSTFDKNHAEHERDRHSTKRDLRRSRQMVCFYVTFMQGVNAGSTVLFFLICHISWKREKVNISLDVDRLSWVSQDETTFWLFLFETGPQICSSRVCLKKREILRKKGLHYSFIPTDVMLSGQGISRRFHGDI